MTSNLQMIYNIINARIWTEFNDSLPSLSDITRIAEETREMCKNNFKLEDDEFKELKNKLETEILHEIDGVTITLKGKDSDHKPWYFDNVNANSNDGYYWNRFNEYLRRIKHWGLNVVSSINKTTDEIMDELGNPNDHDRAFQRRGLLLGDVQSGKTATYTAVCNKAADAGYKIIIVLAGMTENLRVQTQSRLDEEFVGLESKYALDGSTGTTIGNNKVGVGKIPPFNQDKHIAWFTSVMTDFDRTKIKGLGLSLNNMTSLFVVKKNKSVLNNLHKWLVDNNAERTSGIVDLPLLLIDDEADNASVNTNADDKEPTAINLAIRNILNSFRQASYLGITATPFANIFIDPASEQDEATRDLFPKDFLTVLPTPSRYIGPEKIFGSGDADAWENDNGKNREKGEYDAAIIPIENEEQEKFFVFKHKKELADRLRDLPISLKEAIIYFILVTGISDIRKDNREHRTMLINVSRFIKVQRKVTDLVDEFVRSITADVENYSQLDIKKAMKIEGIAEIATVWERYGLQRISGKTWEIYLREYLYNAVRRIIVSSVNSSNGASSLNYYAYSKTGMRVIAVGGNCLSRGLTLEGLCVSYFYRNTMMYDTLLQMGRWFGYRPNYDDLFKVWMGEDSINWYGYITDAVNELKEELREMERQHQTPAQFGLKVRQAPGSLLVTAKNKMRKATPVSRPICVSGQLLETVRLRGDEETVTKNEAICRKFIELISAENKPVFDKNTKSFVWKRIPKKLVVDLVKGFVTHPWNCSFQSPALAKYISGDNTGRLNKWDVAIRQELKEKKQEVLLKLNAEDYLNINPKSRPLEWDPMISNMLKVYGRHVRISSPGVTKIGLSQEEIKQVNANTDREYLRVKNRNPLLLIHVLWNSYRQKLSTDPDIVFALGLGFPYTGEQRMANYVINVNEAKKYVIFEGDEDDEDID